MTGNYFCHMIWNVLIHLSIATCDELNSIQCRFNVQIGVDGNFSLE